VNCYGEDLCTRTLSRTATRLGCEDRIRFLGHRDLATLWDDHHAFVLPSRSEGYSLAMIEAMAHGRLPIVSKVGDNEHHIRDGLNGFLLPSLTVDGMDSALEHAWQARDRWREIGLEARNTVDRVLPRDPVGYFADLLLTLCSA